ncbi:MAG: hypothetical protein V1899_05005 [Planctomycetota bacterium]
MTKTHWAIVAILATSVVCVFSILGVQIASIVQTSTPSNESKPSIIREVQNTPVPRNLCNVSDYLQKVKPLSQRFNDATALAGSTPRINLSQLISQMQSARREMQNISPPDYARVLHSTTIRAMDAIIDSFMLFMANAPTSQVNKRASEAVDLWKEANDELNRLLIACL